MIGPSSCISKILLTALFLLVAWYIFMDINLYLRIKNFPIDRSYFYNNSPSTDVSQYTHNNGELVAGSVSIPSSSSSSSSTQMQTQIQIQSFQSGSSTEHSHIQYPDIITKRPINYEDNVWISCTINPICTITIKSMLLDQTNHYLFSPLATIFDDVIGISRSSFITANMISYFHVFVAILAGRLVASTNLCNRRLGVVFFQFRTFLDDLDGHVARQKKHIRGERSEIGTFGFYLDGLCDGLGCIALMIGIFIFLKNNPPRRGYTQLQAILPTTNETMKHSNECSITYKVKVTTKKVTRKIVCFSLILLLSSTGWNRYIAIYQDMLERNDVPSIQFERQNLIMRSDRFFSIAWLWRCFNVHALLHCLLLSIFCDKIWEFLRMIQFIGFVVLLCIICATEMHILEVESFIFSTLTGNNTAL